MSEYEEAAPYETWTVKELEAEVRARDVTASGRAKAELIAALEIDDAEAEGDTVPEPEDVEPTVPEDVEPTEPIVEEPSALQARVDRLEAAVVALSHNNLAVAQDVMDSHL